MCFQEGDEEKKPLFAISFSFSMVYLLLDVHHTILRHEASHNDLKWRVDFVSLSLYLSRSILSFIGIVSFHHIELWMQVQLTAAITYSVWSHKCVSNFHMLFLRISTNANLIAAIFRTECVWLRLSSFTLITLIFSKKPKIPKFEFSKLLLKVEIVGSDVCVCVCMLFFWCVCVWYIS